MLLLSIVIIRFHAWCISCSLKPISIYFGICLWSVVRHKLTCSVGVTQWNSVKYTIFNWKLSMPFLCAVSFPSKAFISATYHDYHNRLSFWGLLVLKRIFFVSLFCFPILVVFTAVLVTCCDFCLVSWFCWRKTLLIVLDILAPTFTVLVK